MIPNTSHRDDPSIEWQKVTLRGGPFDGQVMRIHRDDDLLELNHNGVCVVYHRVNHKPELHVDERLGKLLSGGKRGQR